MPSTTSFEIFVRQQPLIAEEWIRLIEARRELIKPYLNSFTLSELGNVKCLRRENFVDELGSYFETCGDARFSLKTQGIFFMQPWAAIEYTPNSGSSSSCHGVYRPRDGTKKIWGLTRSAEWVIATVSFAGTSGYKERGREVMTGVEIVEADVARILAETKTPAEEIWRNLGSAIKDFTKKRRSLYAQAQQLANRVEAEELLLPFVPGTGIKPLF